jgi:hypothetical protein
MFSGSGVCLAFKNAPRQSKDILQAMFQKRGFNSWFNPQIAAWCNTITDRKQLHVCSMSEVVSLVQPPKPYDNKATKERLP